jgi:hypothetical protein
MKGKSVDGGSPTVFVHIQGTALANMMKALFPKKYVANKDK